ncbi:hypothetical protein PSME7519_24355 [Ectopseudomonas mendocina]
MGLLVRLHVREAHAAALPLQHLIHRVVLEHQQGVEQFAARAPGQLLQAEQRHLLVLTQRQVVRLQRVEPIADALMRVRCLHHRQGVDEKPQHALDARHRRRTPRHGCAEDHLAPPAVTLQQQCPGALDQGVEGDPPGLGEGLQLDARQRQPVHADRLAWRLAAQVAREQGRLVEALQLLTPKRLTGRLILALQPAQVIAIKPWRLQLSLAAGLLQHLRQQGGAAPAVEQDVVQRPDQLIAPLTQTDQHQTHQRWLSEIERRFALLTQ